MEYQCEKCDNKTYYSCVKCSSPVCNRPDCSEPVSPSTIGYSEDHPKRVSLCSKCIKKKKQSNLSSFFTSSRYAILLFLLYDREPV